VAPPAPVRKTRTRDVGFQVLTGSPGTLKESLDAGAGGAVLAFAACAPQACQEIFTAWKEHDDQLALDRQQHIARASQVIGSQLGVAGIKYACDWNGYFGGWPRSPLLPLNADTKSEVELLLTNIRN
jgi:dihydrodipicolinate synthase/N-acetylneuraminate lyase